MIVKNEEAVIERCLASVRPLIHSWCIVDTGSTDKTKELVKKSLEGVSGELHERAWKNFGTNRTEALELARGKAEYALVIDADDVLKTEDNFVMPGLTKEAYELRVEYARMSYYRMHLFRNDIGFRYEGVLHEYATCDKTFKPGRIGGLVYNCIGGGGRSLVTEKEKYRNDATVLERALREEPDNARYVFYLAQSWRDAGDPVRAITVYERRAMMTNGFYEEAFVSLLEIARLKQKIHASEHEIVAAYMRAFERLPHRIEPLFELARYFRSSLRFAVAYVYAKACLGVQLPPDILFVSNYVYEWGALDEFAINAYYVNEIQQAIASNQSLLANPKLPNSERPRIEKNLELSVTKFLSRSA